MRMYSILAAITAAGLMALPTPSFAAESKGKPLVVVFAVPYGDKEPVPSDPEAVAATASLLAEGGKVDVLQFAAELPAVTRAILERKLRQEDVRNASDAPNSVRIAGLLGGNYALRVRAAIAGSKVTIDGELFKVPTGGRWVASAESTIAESGTAQGLNRRNAVMTAASAMVSRMSILALGGSAIAVPSDTSGSLATEPSKPTDATEIPRDVVVERDAALRQADQYEKKNDLANAIHALRQAVDLTPTDVQIRLKLAATYAKFGMTMEAIEECKRALLFGKDEVAVYNALAAYYITAGDLESAAAQCREIIRIDPNNADVRLNLGDIYWNQGKVEDSQKAYEEATQLNPKNAAAHERLYKLLAARNDYASALDHLLQARQAGRESPPSADERYALVAQIVEDQFNAVLGRLKSSWDDFDKKRLAREDFYQECREIDAQAEGLVRFLSAQAVPERYKDAHPRGVLASSLLSQSTGSLLTYLETDRKQYSQDADVLLNQAKMELAAFLQIVRGG